MDPKPPERAFEVVPDPRGSSRVPRKAALRSEQGFHLVRQFDWRTCDRVVFRLNNEQPTAPWVGNKDVNVAQVEPRRTLDAQPIYLGDSGAHNRARNRGKLTRD